jgi:hydrogenase maturation protease
VLGLGNILNRDEGMGVYVLRSLEERLGEVPDLDLVDGGVMGLNLLQMVEASDHLLVLDAVDTGSPAGTVTTLSREEIPRFSGIKMSQHQVTFQEVLGLAEMRGKLPPHLHLVGAQPDDLSIGLGLSETVTSALPTMVDAAVEVLTNWHLLPSPF